MYFSLSIILKISAFDNGPDVDEFILSGITFCHSLRSITSIKLQFKETVISLLFKSVTIPA